jgi:hypothetical protein
MGTERSFLTVNAVTISVLIMKSLPCHLRYLEVPVVEEGKGLPPARLTWFSVRRGAPMHYQLRKDETKIGRKMDSDIILISYGVSRCHAVVLKTENGCVLSHEHFMNDSIF